MPPMPKHLPGALHLKENGGKGGVMGKGSPATDQGRGVLKKKTKKNMEERQ